MPDDSFPPHYPVYDFFTATRYFNDKEDWFSLNLDEAVEAGWESLDFSDDVNVYLFGNRWMAILDGTNTVDLTRLREAHAGDTDVEICVAVSGTRFSQTGLYTVSMTPVST